MSTAEQVLAIARAEVGYHEGRSGGNWNNHQKYSPAVPGLEWSQNQAWCCTFCSWVFMKAGLTPAQSCRTASCDLAVAEYKKRGRWSEYPARGAQGFLGRNGDMHHTFLVEDYDATWIYTIEGNSNDNGSAEGDGVYRHKRRRTDPEVVGYGYPSYVNGIQSADPAFAPVRETPYKPKPKPSKARKRGPNIDRAIRAIDKAHAYAAKHKQSTTALDRAKSWLNKFGKK